jgi:TP901 family phage tail tape measure protein
MPEKFADLGSIAADISLDLSGVKSSRSALARELSAIGTALDRMAEQAEASGKRAEAALKKGASTDVLRRQQAELKKVSEARERLAQSTARAVSLAGVGIAGALSISVKEAMAFDKALRNVNSIAKLNERSFAELRKDVLALTKDPSIVDGPQNLAEGLYDVYSAGFQGQKALEVLRVSARGASAGLTTTKVAADVLTSVLNSGIKGVTSTSDAMDVLFQSVNDGKQNFEQLATSIGAVLPTAAKAGITLQEVGSAIAVMTAKGQSASEATNDLLNLITKLINPSRESEKYFQALGISYGYSALQASGLSGKMEEIRQKTNGNADAIKELLPDMQAQRGALNLLSQGNLTYGAALDNAKRASEGAGAAQKALAEQQKSASFQAQKAWQEIQALAIEIGSHLLPAVREVLKPIRDVTRAFSELDPATQKNIVQFAALTLGIGFVASKVAGLIGLIGELKIAFAGAQAPAWLAGAGRAGTLGALAVPAALTAGGVGLMAYGMQRQAAGVARVNAGAKAEGDAQKRMTPAQLRAEAARYRARAQEIRSNPASYSGVISGESERRRGAEAAGDADFIQPGSLRGRAQTDGRMTADARKQLEFAEGEAARLERLAKQPKAAPKAIPKATPTPGPGKNPFAGKNIGGKTKKTSTRKPGLTDAQRRARQLMDDTADAVVRARQFDAEQLGQQFDDLFGGYNGKFERQAKKGEDPNNPAGMSIAIGEQKRFELVNLVTRILASQKAAADAEFNRNKKDRPDGAAEAQFEAVQRAESDAAERLKKIREKDAGQSKSLDADALAATVASLEKDIAEIDAELAKPESERASVTPDAALLAARRSKRGQIASKTLSSAATRAAEGGAGLEEARVRYQSALDEADREYEDALAKLSTAQREESLKRLEFDREMGNVGVAEYRARLVSQIAAEAAYSDRWMSLKQKLKDFDEKQVEESKARAKDALDEKLRLLNLEADTGARSLDSYREALETMLASAAPYSEEWERLWKLLQGVNREIQQGLDRDLADAFAELDAEMERKGRILRGFKEGIADELGRSVAEFRSFEDFFKGWQSRIQRIVMDLVAEIVTNWARVQLGLPGADGQKKGGGKGSGGGDGLDTALGIATMIPGVGPWAAGALGLKKIFGFADGGVLRANVPALVGEAGGEFIVPRVPSLAVPAAMLSEIAARVPSGGGSIIVGEGAIQVTIHGDPSRADIGQLADDIAYQLASRMPAIGNGTVLERL